MPGERFIFVEPAAMRTRASSHYSKGSTMKAKQEDDIELLEPREDAAEAFNVPGRAVRSRWAFVESTIVPPGNSRLESGGTTGIIPRSSTS